MERKEISEHKGFIIAHLLLEIVDNGVFAFRIDILRDIHLYRTENSLAENPDKTVSLLLCPDYVGFSLHYEEVEIDGKFQLRQAYPLVRIKELSRQNVDLRNRLRKHHGVFNGFRR
ncbi:hypothetical protein ES703_96594 [subsurface metagenome]